MSIKTRKGNSLLAQWMRPHTPSAAPRWGSQVPHTTTQSWSPSWTGHREDTGLLKKKRQAIGRKTALKASHQQTRPQPRARDPRRQPDPHPPFTEPQTTRGRGALQNQDGTWPWAGYHPANLRQESLQSVPLPRSLPGSAPFPDAPPGQDAQHPVAPPPPPQGRPLPLMQVPPGVRSPPGTAWPPPTPSPRAGTAPRRSWLPDSGESAPPRPAQRRARCPPRLAARTQLRPPELLGTSWAAATPTGRARVASWAPPTGTVSYMRLRDAPAHPHLDFSGIGGHPQAAGS